MSTDPRLRDALSELASLDRPGLQPVEVRLRRGGGSPSLEERMGAIASAVARACRGVSLGDDRGPAPPSRPALTLAGGGGPPIHYLALPEGAEAAPFAEALRLLAEGAATTRGTLRAHGGAAEILVLVAPGCPNCPQAVRAALSLLSTGHRFDLTVVDVTAFPDLVEPFKPRSVPVTVLDRRIRVVGVSPPERLGRLLSPPGTDERDRDVLATLLENGQLAEAAQELDHPWGVAAFASLWSDSTLQTRMGLMLAADAALEGDPAALDRTVPDLRASLRTGDRSRRGDTAELLGKIGSEAAREALAAVVDDPDEEVAEAATDALEELEQRGRTETY